MSAPWLAILGVADDGVFTPEVAGLVEGAALVVGSARHLALAAPLIRGEAMRWPSPMTDAIPGILARRPASVAVLASGDPMWFGAGATLLRHVPIAEVLIIPAPSSFALAAARLGWALQDVACLSCCGRPVAALVPRLQPGARLLVLCADAGTPATVAALLDRTGFGGSTIHLLEALGSPRERVRRWPADAVDPLVLLGIELCGGPGFPLTPGLPDASFESDGQLTKSEVRAITLSALAPRQGELLWDIGAGSGSVGIEWMLRHPANRAVAVERRADRAERIGRNAETLGVPGLRVEVGEAPAVLAALPVPDAVFIGGGVHAPGMIDGAWTALRAGGRLVANAISLPGESALLAARERLGGTLTRIGVERLDQVGAMAAFRPAMTVTQWRACKPLVVAGVGCRRGVAAEAVLELLRMAAERSGRVIDAVAAPHWKRGETGLVEAAAELRLPLLFAEEAALLVAGPRTVTRSAAAERTTGHPSVAEAAALAVGGGRLVLPRIIGRGVTCAVVA